MNDTSDSFLEWFDTLTNFFASESFQVLGKFTILYLAALWVALIVWVTRDAIHRSSNVVFQIIAVLLNIFLPIFGLILYLIIRPEKTLLEKYHEDLEYRLLEGGDDICYACGTPVKEGFAFCPNCGEELNEKCPECKKESSRRWKICPYCGKEKHPKKKSVQKKKGKSDE